MTAGKDILVVPHDQLDGEVLTYILHAHHLGEAVFPEMMNGISSSGMQLAAPAFLILYVLLPAWLAYSIGYAFIMVTAYCGLWGLSRHFGVRSWLCSICSLFFAFLPFYGVYGLSIMGVPLLAWAACAFWRNPSLRTRILSLIVTVAYATCSSFVLIGFAILVIAFAAFVAVSIRAHRVTSKGIWCAILALVLLFCYVLENMDLVLQFMNFGGVKSHREEFVLQASSIELSSFLGFLFNNQNHAIANQRYILLLALPMSVYAIILMCNRNASTLASRGLRSLAKIQLVLLASVITIALFYYVFHSSYVVSLRSNLPSSVRSFQLDRVYWFGPSIWYFMLAIECELFLRAVTRKTLKAGAMIVIALVMALTGFLNVRQSSVVRTVASELTEKQYEKSGYFSWREFFAEDLFEQLKEYLGGEATDASFVSVGLYPSIALYNGLNCLDGYSNNYPLEYKEAFRRVIGDELESSSDLKTYYDDWGSRAYVFSHELGMDFLIGKTENKKISQFNFGTEAFKELGGDYVISSVPIENAESQGLDFLRRFESQEAYYDIYLYGLK